MYCKKCGSKLGEGASFCSKCGANQNEVSTANYQQQMPKKKKHGCLIAILIVIGVVAIASVIGMILETSNQDTSQTMNTQDNMAQQSNQIALGTEESIGDLTLTVNSSSLADEISVGNGMFQYTPDSGQYAIVNVTLINRSKSSQSFYLSSFQLENESGARYVPTIIPTADEKFLSIDSINPEISVTGNIAFSVPGDVDLSTFHLIYKGNSKKFNIQ